MQLASTSFVPQVVSLLRQYRVRPARLVLEARETALIGANPDVQRTVRALRRIGVRIAIDNFGTGANALSVLTDVGADILKLDGSLALPVRFLRRPTPRLVRALVLLAHALEMQVVAERVSGAEQLRRLRAAGCDLLQGNLLGPPDPADRRSSRTSPSDRRTVALPGLDGHSVRCRGAAAAPSATVDAAAQRLLAATERPTPRRTGWLGHADHPAGRQRLLPPPRSRHRSSLHPLRQAACEQCLVQAAVGSHCLDCARRRHDPTSRRRAQFWSAGQPNLVTMALIADQRGRVRRRAALDTQRRRPHAA